MRQAPSYVIETIRDGRKFKVRTPDCANGILGAVKQMLEHDVIEVNIRISNEHVDQITEVNMPAVYLAYKDGDVQEVSEFVRYVADKGSTEAEIAAMLVMCGELNIHPADMHKKVNEMRAQLRESNILMLNE